MRSAQIVEGLYFGFGLGPVGLGPVGLGPVGLAVGPVAGLGGSAVAVGSAAVGSAVTVGAAVGSAVAVGCVGVGAVGCGATAGPVLVLRAVVVGRALVPGLPALLESGFARIDSIRARSKPRASHQSTIAASSLSLTPAIATMLMRIAMPAASAASAATSASTACMRL